MRKTFLIITALALAWVGFLAWPAYDLARFTRAIERGDAAAAARYINFARVRASLTQQITEAYLQRTGARPGPLVHGAVASIADPVVAKLISPQALTELLRIGWPRAAVAEPPRDAVGISTAGLGTAWQLFAASEYGIGRYEVSVPVGEPPERAFMLQFRLAQWRWRLAAVRVPEAIQALLADELIKSTRPLPQQHRP
jgi:hypothetical protein